MSRASKRAGFGQQRGATSNKMAYNTVAPNLPKDGDRWVDKATAQEYIYDKDSTQWIPLFGGGYGGGSLGGLVYVDTDVVTTVSSLQTVAYVTASVERTASIIATACINGNASTTMTVTSYVMLNATTVNTIVETVELGDDHITNIDLVIEDVPAGTNDIWVQQTVDTGNWVLYASEQHLYALTFYNVILGGSSDVGGATTTAYVFGGNGITGQLNDTDEYTPDTWTAKTNMNTVKDLMGGFTISSKIYSLYGRGVSAVRTQDTEEYIPDTWTSKTNGASPERAELTSSSIDTAGYSFAGRSNASVYISDTDEYIPDTWTSKTDMPSPARKESTSSTIGSSSYLFAGRSSSPAYMQDNDEYTPDTWTSKTSLPTPARRDSASTTIDSSSYVMGGFTGSVVSDNDEYTPDTWTSKTNLPSPTRYYSHASSINNVGYIYCGNNSSFANISDTDEYIPDTWTSKTDIISPARAYHISSTL